MVNRLMVVMVAFRVVALVAVAMLFVSPAQADDRSPSRIDVWPDYAPGETTKLLGEEQPKVAGENPPVTRVINITRPTLAAFPALKPNGTAVVVLPGGGFGKVVTDKEGSEAARWLNELGVSVFVLSYRTTVPGKSAAGWERPLQDAQRSLSLIRSRAAEWGVKPDRIGLVGFSAGGNVAARLLCDAERRSYRSLDAVDDVSCRPNFAVLIYPWNIYDSSKNALVDVLVVPKSCPPTFLVHTDDDRSSAMGPVLFYAGLKQHGIPSELHVYGNGGHGYGLRPVKGSQISTWTDHASHWLGTQGFLSP